jgi:transcriptional regulator with XRE-family HTH domain
MAALGISQSELARRVGVSQSAIHKLTSGGAYGSKHLHTIASELGTTPAYLEAKTDNPDENAPSPPPPPRVQFVTLQVALPSENALARMFEGLLRSMPDATPLDEQALLLAKRLPIGLSQLRDLLPESVSARPEPLREAAEALATPDRERPQ